MATPDIHRARNLASFCPRMCSIPEGFFLMGCETGRDDEKPVHRVWVDAFKLSAFQATNAQYARFLEASGNAPPALWNDPDFNDPDQPVVAVSWLESDAYCHWLSELTQQTFRLPTEAEWERAARGGREGESYPWGNCQLEDIPNYASRWKRGPEKVGLYPPNSYGLFNLGDNVHEWCADWYDASYYSISPERNPPGSPSSPRRASRGGSWRHQIKVTRTAARSSIPPQLKYADYGFRVAANPQ
jgi:formylglycine-generating enzyme required for sulfatase activity